MRMAACNSLVLPGLCVGAPVAGIAPADDLGRTLHRPVRMTAEQRSRGQVIPTNRRKILPAAGP